MPDQTLTLLNQLTADFCRLDDRAPWTRAVFSLKGGKFGLFTVGPALGDGVDTALSRSVPGGREFAFNTELSSLTDQAGVFAKSLIQSNHLKWKPICATAANFQIREHWEFWLFLLVHTPPACFHCETRGANGEANFGPPRFGEHLATYWIDSYPQVCVSALASLKVLVLADKDNQKKPPQELDSVASTASESKHIPPIDQNAQQKPPEPVAIFPEKLSAAELARFLEQPVPRVESFLRKLRKSRPDCYFTVKTPRKNEARILYRTSDVWDLLQGQLGRWGPRQTDG